MKQHSQKEKLEYVDSGVQMLQLTTANCKNKQDLIEAIPRACVHA